MKPKIALLLIFMMVFSLAACGGQPKSESNGESLAAVIREVEPSVLQTGNEATAIALKQYVHARLLTEHLATQDFTQFSEADRNMMIDQLVASWAAATEFSVSAEELTDQAVMEMENTATLPVLIKNPFKILATVYGAEDTTEFDQKAWAEKLTEQYDALKGAKRYNQLAKQLGVDAKTAYEQMILAQEIIRKGAIADADWNNKVVNTLQAIKTTSKVTLLGLSAAATGGGSVTLLEGAGFIAGGIDCAIEVADTGSTIILGEGNKVAVGFNDLKKKTAPVTSVIGLLNFDSSNLEKWTNGTADALVFISDSLMDLYHENKVLGMEISTTKDGKVVINGQAVDVTGLNGETLDSALEAAGYPLPVPSSSIIEMIENAWNPDIEVMKARMGTLTSKITEEVEENQPDMGAGSIAGTYTSNMTHINGESETTTVIIKDNGDGTVTWESDDGEGTIFDYNEETNEIFYSEAGFTFQIKFSVSAGQVTGSGRMFGEFGEDSLDTSIELSKQ